MAKETKINSLCKITNCLIEYASETTVISQHGSTDYFSCMSVTPS